MSSKRTKFITNYIDVLGLIKFKKIYIYQWDLRNEKEGNFIGQNFLILLKFIINGYEIYD